MQITTEVMRKFAETTVEKLTRVDHTIVGVYLTGSMVTEENPFLGGAADVDLIFIHIGEPEVPREILRLSDEVHLDIAHHAQRDYLQRLELRVHPWFGPILAEAVVLYDPQHFIDLTQASVRGLFHRAENAVKRAKASHENARNLWDELQHVSENPSPKDIAKYLRSLGCAANAVALLSGEPLTERRFLPNFPQRAEAVDRQGMVAGLLGLLGAPKVKPQELTSWVIDWETTVYALPQESRHPRLHPYRHEYYRMAFDALIESGQPENVLWPLLRNWTLAAQAHSEGDPALQPWKDAYLKLGLLGPEFPDRIAGLGMFLGQVDETINTWAVENGG
jgi:hypothetical protein